MDGAVLSLHEYKTALRLHRDDTPFYALIMAATMGADSLNLERLRSAFPGHVEETQRRWQAAGGILPGEHGYEEIQRKRAEIGMPPT